MRALSTCVSALRFITLTNSTDSQSFSTLFVGIGNQIHVHALGTEHPAISATALPNGERIHGFSKGLENRVIVHGGRFAAIISANNYTGSSAELVVASCAECEDWVWSSRWITQGRFLALACGHSTVEICDRSNLNRRFRIECVERELTWATSLFASTSKSSLRAVGGTSFGDVLFWTVLDHVSDEQIALKLQQAQEGPVCQFNTGHRKHAHRVQAHDGPIMKLEIAQDAQRMVSASVDRSICVWQNSNSPQCCVSQHDEFFVPVLRHYGHLARIWDVSFLDQRSMRVVSVGEDRSCRVWSETAAGGQLGVFHGHAGRNVWSLDVLSVDRTSALVATGGEDGGVKLRSIAIPSNDTNLNLNIDRNTTAKYGTRKCVLRSYRIPGNYANPRKSGGAYNESGRTLLLVTDTLLFVSTDFGRILAKKISSSDGLEYDPLQEGSRKGLLDNTVSWTMLHRDVAGTAYTPSSLAFCNGLLFGGQTSGDVTVLKISDLSGDMSRAECVATIPAFLKNGGMVMGIFATASSNDALCNLLVATGSGDLYHWQIEVKSDGQIGSSYCGTYRQRNPTKSALVTSALFLWSHGIVVVGDRGGRVLLYNSSRKELSLDATSSQQHDDLRIVAPCAICRPHKDRVSSISRVSSNSGMCDALDEAGTCDLLTTGFDGRMARLRLQFVKAGKSICGNSELEPSISVLSSQKTIEHVDTIARVAFPRARNEANWPHSDGTGPVDKSVYGRQCIIGFRSANLSVWDVAQRNELFRVNCGNWRRAFDVFLDLTDPSAAAGGSRLTVERVTVVFWRAGKLHIVQTVDDRPDRQGQDSETKCWDQSDSADTRQITIDRSVQSLRGGFHGQRANGVCWIDGSNIVLTASEDTMINVSDLSNGDWCKMQILSRHISGVNSVSTTRLSNKLLLTFSGGGSDEVVTWVSSDPQGPWKDVCAIAVGNGSRKRQALHRVTCLDSVDGRFCGCELACGMAVVGRSDGSVGLVRSVPGTGERYRQAGREWDCEMLQVVNEQHRGAVLCCATTTARIGGRETLVAVTGDSQGGVVVWVAAIGQACDKRRLGCVHKWVGAHDGGVNAVDLRVEVDGDKATMVVVSGGDDERVRMRVGWMAWNGERISVDVQEEGMTWESELGTHRAAVTALCFAAEENNGGLGMVVGVSGADQRVNWLEVGRREGPLSELGWEVRVVGEARAKCNVADVGAIAARVGWEGGRVKARAVVAGCGLEAVDCCWMWRGFGR